MIFVDVIILWLVNLFCPDNPKPGPTAKNGNNENLVGFFFGTAHWGDNDNSKPINEDYDKGPDW